MKKTIFTISFLAFIFASNAQITELPNGNVGIATPTPSALLEIRQKEDPNTDRALLITEPNNSQKIYLHLADNASGEYGYFHLGGNTNLRGNGVHSSFDGALGIGTPNPGALLEIKQKEDPNTDRALLISEPNNSQKIYLHLADNASGEYGYFHLGGNTNLRGNGVHSSFDGAVGIGVTNPGAWKLAVNGKIRAKEISIETGWADFVFDKDYDLPTLKEVENHIKKNGHLKDIPSAKEVAKNGVFLGEMNTKLLQKIEELTLYTIQQQKEINNQQREIQDQEQEIIQLKNQNEELKSLSQRLNKVEKLLKINN
ncbi:hypothetical protein D1816_15210 [Aquimarina sp. AD10]|uniref:hypothetical protein n=1 Tax=Aquimarina sp. AD10 TaxID=1714849 RepID=UPI000E50296E|nr:hypothetical protein [Aquimarina sp. AD10]AXT61643.1 hypothetical protein D1816_15210 [Aquimarina sp. AD10]RKN01008.1 hypothetical protein D7033_06555 [Aquimarina sp. AD10]